MIFSKPARARRASTEPAVDEMVSYLQEHLGSGVTAYLSGAEDPQVVEKWLDGRAELQTEHESRLRPAYKAARYVVEAYDDDTAMQWFFGMNPALDDSAPAYVLRHGPEDQRDVVVPAAMEFVETAR